MAHFIHGQWLKGDSKIDIHSTDPIYNTLLWQGLAASDKQVDMAVKSARKAFDHWSCKDFSKRLTMMEKFRDLLTANQEHLTQSLAEETGKPLWESKIEITGMISKLASSLTAYEERTGQKTIDMGSAQAMLRHRPHGVIVVFGPFNFPGHLPNGHIIPALLAGNTIVFKPSEYTPRFAEETIKLWQQAGLPDGVLNLVQGKQDTGKALASHPDINGLFFTGSSRVGRLIHQQFGGQPEKILALEMGGNNPLIVFEAQDLNAVAYHTIQSAFLTAGQRCVCARRLIIPDGAVGDDIIHHLLGMTEKMVVAAYDAEPQPFMGSLISAVAGQGILKVQDDLMTQGAEPLLKACALNDSGSLLSPAIIDSTAIRRSDQEYFGPLLQVIRVPSFAAAIIEANNTQYGLSAGILTDNPEYYAHYLACSRAGIVNWNRQTTGASGDLPFGGVGCSGNHRPSAYYAADYCAYPVASVEDHRLTVPDALTPGFNQGLCMVS